MILCVRLRTRVAVDQCEVMLDIVGDREVTWVTIGYCEMTWITVNYVYLLNRTKHNRS